MENMQKMKQLLLISIFEVFEKMFYVFLEPADNSDWVHESAASISFSSSMKGQIEARFSKGIADVMVQNMLNIAEGEITEKLKEDCLKESVNMICGNFLRNYDSATLFKLSIPVCHRGTDKFIRGESVSSEPALRLGFTSGSGMLEITLTVAKT